MDKISIIVPCFNEEEAIPVFYATVQPILDEAMQPAVSWELVFVDDGSTDATLELLQALHAKDPRVAYLSFSRNFGKEAGLYAGLLHATGDYVAVMDVDLQDPPELLPDMYAYLLAEPLDCVATKRVDRAGEPWLRSLFARLFYWLMSKISQTEIVAGARDFRLMSRPMVDAILSVGEYNRFSKGIFSWVGFRTHYLAYPNRERRAGRTSWSFWGLVRYSLTGIINFSEVPLNFIAGLGFMAFLGAILLAVFFAGRTLLFGNATSGWTSLAVLILGMGGLQMLALGVVGKYVAKTFLETKRRPLYLLKMSSFEEDDEAEAYSKNV